MKKLLLMMAAVAVMGFTGCSKDNDTPSFNYDLEVLCGTWDGIGINSNGEWIDITKFPYTEFAFTATFNTNGTYSGSGYFGNGSGTYTAVDDMIITYVEGEEYARYKIVSIEDNVAEMTMSVGDKGIGIRCKKR